MTLNLDLSSFLYQKSYYYVMGGTHDTQNRTETSPFDIAKKEKENKVNSKKKQAKRRYVSKGYLCSQIY